MTKEELIQKLAATSGQSRKAVEAVLDAQGLTAQATLKEGGEFILPGIGKLSVVRKAGRTGRNPKTGEPLLIAPKAAPHFTGAKVLKDAIPQPH